MNLAVRMKNFKRNRPSPSEQFARHISVFKEAIEEAHDRLKDGPAIAKAVLHDGTVEEIKFPNFTVYYATVAVLWKQVAEDFNVYLEYMPDSKNFVVGDIFHKLDCDSVPLVFVCNMKQTSNSGEMGLSRILNSEDEGSKYRQAAVYCDGLYDTASQTVDFFQHRRKTRIYSIEVDHGLLVCNSMESVQRLAKSITGEDEWSGIVNAIVLSVERSEFVADVDVMFNRRAFALACHELGHMIIQMPSFESVDKELSETVARATELKYSDMKRTLLAEMFFDSFIPDTSWRSRTLIEYFNLTMERNRMPIPLGYAILPDEKIEKIASILLDIIAIKLYGKKWADLVNDELFERVRKTIFNGTG
ncbi:MAG: hypothetical protein Q7S22_01070 [Candidatus Micrarchaeota archaeon]|nr:hypothetical protein [Candidatus Micrarchaeota archaeon]